MKLVITGARTEEDLRQAFTKLYPVLLDFRKLNVATLPGLPSGGSSNTAATTQSGKTAKPNDSHREIAEV